MRIFLLYLIVYTYLLLGAYSYASDLPEGVLKAEQATYKVVIDDGYVNGTGFFIAPDLFVTNFHVINGIKDIKDISLDRDDKPSIKVKKLVSISVYADLAIFRTEQKSDIYLSEGEKSLFHEGGFTIGYPRKMRKPVTIRSVREINIMENVYYGAFFELGFVENVEGMSGGPLLDSKGSLLGILYSASESYVMSILSSYLQELLYNHIGTVCGNQPRKCIDYEILKAKKLINQLLDSNYLIPKKEGTFFHFPRGLLENFLFSTDDIVRYLSKGAELNHPIALFNLGEMYYYGKGVKKDFKKAVSYFERAANMNHLLAPYNVGAMYDNGEGVERDREKAISYYERAASMGYQKAIDELESTLVKLGEMYYYGEGVERDREKAISYYERAANMNHPLALYNVGIMYDKGEGVERDREKAFSYYERVANMGYPKAIDELESTLVKLGEMYYYGEGAEQDFEKAFSYYERAANMNHPLALYNVGIMYDKGEGVERDREKAVSYYERAANMGYQKAIDVL